MHARKRATGNRAGGDRATLIDPQAYAEVAPQFGHLERIAVTSDNTDAAHHLRKARMAVIKVHVSIPPKQTDMRAYTEPSV